MDKKFGRSIQPFSKGPNFDKKNQDSNNGKVWTKAPNRRESASGSLSIRPEAARKNPPQQFRTFDKRPRPRGQQDAVVRDEASSLEEHKAELGSVIQSGSKKQNLNHLLNFSYAPRNVGQRQYGSGGVKAKSGNYSFYAKKQKYVKEHFLQANCQFIVNTSGDYKQYLLNPDAMVDWNYIEQINVQVNDSPSCPICLHSPMAAKITRCGHIYCWCCILHYLCLSDTPSRKCPICYENLCREDLKSVTIITHDTFKIGETITFKLMKRALDSLTPCPAEEKTPDSNNMMSFSEDQPTKIYCKLLLANNADIFLIIERERNELKYQLEHEEESEKCFIEEALIYLSDRERRLVEEQIHDADNVAKSSPENSFGHVSADSVVTDNSAFLDEVEDPKCIYFYQACDGQHIYIHSINVRMLKHTYGSLDLAPNTITAKILAKESDSMTENYRKCYKYLAHLPVTCSFETVEIELKSPVVSQDTMDAFHAELEERKRKRVKKSKEEKRREKRITEEENIKFYKKYPTTVIPLESPQQFPMFVNEHTLTDPSETSTNIDYNLPHCSNQEHSGLSFAKMAATAKPTATSWPNLKSSPVPIVPTITSKLKDLTVISGRRRFNSNQSNSDDPESSDFELVRGQRSTFGDAIAQALQKATDDNLTTETTRVNEKSKKKKKYKQKILLSTSLGYSGN